MRILFLDFETTDTEDKRGKRNPSPFLAGNYLVSYGWRTHGYASDSRGYRFLHHRDYTDTDGLNFHLLQSLLDECELLVAFNAKFELEWLLEAGYRYSGKVADPMVTAYVLAKGVTVPMDLDSCCRRVEVKGKFSDKVKEYWDAGLGFDKMPMPVIEEYGLQDVDSLYDLYWKHLELLELEENASLVSVIRMSWEFIWCLVDMERNGIYIDAIALQQVKEEFTSEYNKLKQELEVLARSVMGYTPCNLDSPEQLSQIIYSRKVKDKNDWKERFNIGVNERGKRRKPPRMSAAEFVEAVKTGTTLLHKTNAIHCVACGGRGRVYDKLTKSGQQYKKPPKCRDCAGRGIILCDTGKIAGFRLSPSGPFDTATGGFSTDKETLERLANRCGQEKLEAKAFLTKMIRYNAIGTYLETFIGGIERGIGPDNILHTQLMQCITKTGRLSSQSPNFQNMPRAKTFPVRKAVKSRFKDGKILEVDFKTLEFTAAAFIYQDLKAIEDIKAHFDVHSYTSKVLTDSGQPTDRQDAKPHTFKPLYGGSSGTKAEQAYYQAFKEKYQGVTKGQERDIQKVLKTGVLTTPSGRQYRFPNTKRTANGYVSNTTQICNYPVQGFATADIVPTFIIELRKELNGQNSLIILTVHDSVVIDCRPDDIANVLESISAVFRRLLDVLSSRFGCNLNVPLEGESKIGDDWWNLKAA